MTQGNQMNADRVRGMILGEWEYHATEVSGGWTIDKDEFAAFLRVADGIAQAAEEEMAKLRGQLLERRTICEAAQKEAEANFVEMRLAQDEVAKLRAQATKMCRVLLADKRDIIRLWGYNVCNKDAMRIRDEAKYRIDQALSATPKVVHYSVGKWDDSEEHPIPILFVPYEEGIGPMAVSQQPPRNYEKVGGQQVEVLVIEI